MKIKDDVDISTGDFWYDISMGGRIKPEEVLENEEDVKRVKEAVKVLMEFEKSCDEQIEDFYL